LVCLVRQGDELTLKNKIGKVTKVKLLSGKLMKLLSSNDCLLQIKTAVFWLFFLCLNNVKG